MSSPSSFAAATDLPLVLDLDGTLCQQDTLMEGLRLALLKNPLLLPRFLLQAASGDRLGLKQHVLSATDAGDYRLSFNEPLLEIARSEKQRGRRVVVATAAMQDLADRLLEGFDFIDEVIGSNAEVNLKGNAKAARLRERFPEGFIYAGNDSADLPVWSAASEAVAVNTGGAVKRKLSEIKPEHHIVGEAARTGRSLLRALRVHQWAKNLLAFVPLILSGQAGSPAAWLMTITGFVALCAMSSSAYLVNDLVDLEADRNHWSKRRRPFASGALPLWLGVLLAPLLVLFALGLALPLGWAAVALLLAYLLLTLAYSFFLKRIPMVDVFCLAFLFTLRLIFGGEIVSGEVSDWLFAYSILFFASLAATKRVVELQRLTDAKGTDRPSGRGYQQADLTPLHGLSYGAGVGSLIVMIIYIIDDASNRPQFGFPGALWLLPMILFLWQSRVWLLTSRDQLKDDPVAFAVKDGWSLLALAVMAGSVLAALYI